MTLIEELENAGRVFNRYADPDDAIDLATVVGNNLDTIIAALKASEWRPIEEAPKDGRYILAVADNVPDSRQFSHYKGRQFVIRHEGLTTSGYDMGWSVFPGFGGAPDTFFTHFKLLGPGPEGEG